MNCNSAKSMLLPFLRDELSAEEVDELTRHLKDCPQCREDLEIYYIVQRGIDGLSKASLSTFDFKEQFERDLSRKTTEAHNHLSLLRTARAFFRTAVMIAVFAGMYVVYRWFF